jgi:hypothetical protein
LVDPPLLLEGGFCRALHFSSGREFRNLYSFNNFQSKNLCKLTVDIFPYVCYNNYRNKEERYIKCS